MNNPLVTRFLPAVLCAWLAILGAPAAFSAAADNDGPFLELRPGEQYFHVNGHAVFVLGRNPAAIGPKAFDEHFRHAAGAGERFMRIHFTYSPPGEKAGEIDAGMLAAWDRILDFAEARGLAVLPVLGVWSNWNDGSHKEHWHQWDRNAFNIACGGPAQLPGELFDDTPCRRLWLKRLETFVRRWSHRRAIVGWEIFSELDLVTGATEERAVDFAERAAAVIRAADPWKRPVTASQAGVLCWPKLTKSAALDFIEIHPYANGPFRGRLDDLILKTVRDRLRQFGKPVLIGESGLDAGPPHSTLDTAPRAAIGIRHAIWAGVVSGAMNGRALWWQDGYDQFEKADLCRDYHEAAATAVAFVRGVDFTNFAPVPCECSPGVKGAVLGNQRLRLAWFRDAKCEPPDWPVMPLSGQYIMMSAPGSIWEAEFFDPITGKTRINVQDGRLRIELGEFQDAVAIRLKQVEP
jgi:hypothetical protein